MRSFMLCGVHKLKESRKAENRGQRDAAPQKPKKPRYQEDMETRKPGNHAGGNEETRKPGNQGTRKASSEAAEDARKPRKAANGETSSQTKRIKRKRGKRRANQRMRAF